MKRAHVGHDRGCWAEWGRLLLRERKVKLTERSGRRAWRWPRPEAEELGCGFRSLGDVHPAKVGAAFGASRDVNLEYVAEKPSPGFPGRVSLFQLVAVFEESELFIGRIEGRWGLIRCVGAGDDFGAYGGVRG